MLEPTTVAPILDQHWKLLSEACELSDHSRLSLREHGAGIIVSVRDNVKVNVIG